jgi:hypothetical protein
MRLNNLALAVATLLLPVACGHSQAQTAVTLGSSGNWSNSAVWNPAVVPDNNGATLYNVTVAGARTATLDMDATLNNLGVGGASSGYSTVALGAGRTLNVNGRLTASLYTQFNGGGTLTLASGGASASNAALFFDNVSFDNLAGSTFSDNGANTAFSTRLGHGAVIQNAGTYSLDGAGSNLLASTGGGAFVNSGLLRGSGSINVPVTSTGAIAAVANSSAGSAGILTFSAGGSSSGTLDTGATANQATVFSAGSWTFASGSVNSGAGVFRVSGAAVTVSGAHQVSGQTQVGSGSLAFTNPGMALGGILYLYGGSTSFTGANSVTQLNLGNPGSASGNPTALLNLGAGGSLTVTGAFNPATYSRLQGTGAASVTATGGGTIADNSSMFLDGVALTNAAGSTLGQYNAGGWDVTLLNGAVIHNAGTWMLRNQAGRGLVAASGAAGAGASFDNTGLLWADVSYTSANIGFALTNSGTLRLDTGAGNGGNPTLAVGTFTQTAGSTQLAHDNGNFATLSSSNPLRFMGGSLTGSGRLLGTVVVSGADTLVSPGVGIGQINVLGSYTQGEGAMTLEIGRTASGTVNDKLTSSGALAVSGTAITFSLLAGSQALHAGDSFTVLASSANGLVLSDDSFSFDASLAGYSFTTTQTAGGYTLTLLAAVPEPGTWATFGAGLLGLALLRLRATRR